jgi:hypothetical protein
MIATLRAKGGDKSIFDKIKYEIASEIESEDLCSLREYDDLMNEIGLAVNQPQVNLETFEDQLNKRSGYPRFFVQPMEQGLGSSDPNHKRVLPSHIQYK